MGDNDNRPSASLGAIATAVTAAQECVRRQETYIEHLEDQVQLFAAMFPQQAAIARTASALRAVSIPWTALPWSSILPFLGPRTVVPLARLCRGNAEQWIRIHNHALASMPVILTIHPSAPLSVQRLVGVCTGEYHFDQTARCRRYQLQNGIKVGLKRIFASYSSGRWWVGHLCSKCRPKKAVKVCVSCLKKQVLMSNSRTHRFPPFDLEWTAQQALVTLGGGPGGSGGSRRRSGARGARGDDGVSALHCHTVQTLCTSLPVRQQTAPLRCVHLTGVPKHLGTLTGNFEKCDENVDQVSCTFNGLPIFKNLSSGRLVVRALAQRQHIQRKKKATSAPATTAASTTQQQPQQSGTGQKTGGGQAQAPNSFRNFNHANFVAMLFRDDQGHWTVKVGTHERHDPAKFVLNANNVAVLRSAECGRLTPCRLPPAIGDASASTPTVSASTVASSFSSSWTWEEEFSLRSRPITRRVISMATRSTNHDADTATQTLVPIPARQWVRKESTCVLAGYVPAADRLFVSGLMLEGSEIEGEYQLVTNAARYDCAQRSAAGPHRTQSQRPNITTRHTSTPSIELW